MEEAAGGPVINSLGFPVRSLGLGLNPALPDGHNTSPTSAPLGHLAVSLFFFETHGKVSWSILTSIRKQSIIKQLVNRFSLIQLHVCS